MDNLSIIALAKNPVFHEKNKHIDIGFHFLRITNKEVEVKYEKTKDQVTDIFTKSLKYNVFTIIKDLLGVIKKPSFRRVLKIKLDLWFFWRIKEPVHRFD